MVKVNMTEELADTKRNLDELTNKQQVHKTWQLLLEVKWRGVELPCKALTVHEYRHSPHWLQYATWDIYTVIYLQ